VSSVVGRSAGPRARYRRRRRRHVQARVPRRVRPTIVVNRVRRGRTPKPPRTTLRNTLPGQTIRAIVTVREPR